MHTPTLGVVTATDAVPLRVLFLSPSNSGRSQIAEALLRAKGGSRFVVASAGPTPAFAVHPAAINALAALGIDWTGKFPKGIDAVEPLAWDFIISMFDPEKEAVPALVAQPTYARWGVPNPATATPGSGRDDPFVKTAHLLLWRIDLMLAIRPDVLERTATTHSARALRRERHYHSDSTTVIAAP